MTFKKQYLITNEQQDDVDYSAEIKQVLVEASDQQDADSITVELVEWIKVEQQTPPIDTPVWAFCEFYRDIHLTEWNGKDKCDDGTPRLKSLTARGDDYWLTKWSHANYPESPL